MVKRIIIIIVILCTVSSAYSQDCCDRLEERAVLIHSLKEDIKQFEYRMTLEQTKQKELSDSLNCLSSDLSSLEKFKSERKSIDDLLQTKSDSIALLKTHLSSKDQQIALTKQQGDQKARAEYERGKAEALVPIIHSYKKPFDDLIKSSSKESVMRDIQLVGSNTEVKIVLNDLQKYFNALELLDKKFDLAQLRKAQTQLNQINQKSTLLDKLKENVDNYQIFNDGLKETLNKLVSLDKLESVAGMDEVTQRNKFNKIWSELTPYFFNYDYNYSNYPYLSDIVLEIIKLKQPDADADVTALLRKLE